MFKKTAYFILLSLLCQQPLLAQFEPIRNFSVRDGLPSGVVYDCLQDKQGFMWFATGAGLARFDGTRFKTFTTADGLSNNEVLQIGLDKDGSIWIFPFGTTPCIYDPSTQKILNEFNYPELKKLHLINIDIQIRKQGDLLIGRSFSNLFFFENKKVDQRVLPNLIDCYIINKDSIVNIINGDTNFVQHYFFGKIKHTAPYNGGIIFDYGSFGSNLEWRNIKIQNTPFALKQYEFNEQFSLKEKKIFYTEEKIFNICRQGNLLYLSTKNGVVLIDTAFKFKQHYFVGHTVSKVFIDRDGNEWICSLSGEGFFMKLNNGLLQYNVQAGLLADNVSSIKVNSYGELLCGDAVGNIYSFKEKNNQIDIKTHTHLKEAVRNIILHKGGFYAFSSSEIFFKDDKEFLMSNTKIGAIKVMLPNENNTFLVGTSALLHKFDPDKQHISNAIRDSVPTRFTALCEYREMIFFGNNDGVFQINQLKPFKTTPLSKESSLLSKPVSFLYATNNGIMWIATVTDGVIAYYKGKVLKHLYASGKADGITSNICKKIFVDEEKQTLWVATNKGINRIAYRFVGDSLQTNVSSITVADGLNDDDVNDVYVKDGKVYAATIKGISVFDATLANRPIPLVITGISIKGQSLDTIKSIYHLNYHQSNISINYAGICFTCNGNINYQYRLLGGNADTSWINTTATTVEFGELKNGNYAFEVKTNETNLQKVVFNIKAAFWQTLWFYVGVTLLFAVLIYLFAGRSIKNIRKREQEKTALNKKFAELELQALQAQMNPHFVYNALNTVQNYILKQDAESASDYLAKFSRLMRLFLEASRNKFTSIDMEIRLLKNYIELEQARQENVFQYHINCTEDVELDTLIPSIMIQPFVENAIVHGLRHRKEAGGLLQISFAIKENALFCVIDDNGAGRTANTTNDRKSSEQYHSHGLNIVNERIKTLQKSSNINVKIEIEDKFNIQKEPVGTCVKIWFHTS